VAKVAVPKTGAQTVSPPTTAIKAAPTNATPTNAASAERPEAPVAAPSSSTQTASSAAPEKRASGMSVSDRPANEQAVRVIGADRITPPPGAPDAAPATSPAPSVIETPPASAAQVDVPAVPKPDAVIAADAPTQPVGIVPLPRNKPASLIADAARHASQIETANDEARRSSVRAVAATDAAESGDTPALITGLIPIPRSKPTTQMPAVAAARATEDEDRVSLFGRAPDDENARTRRASDRRAAIDDRRQADILRRETRRSERAVEMAAERTANDRAREVRRRNEDEGFELVRSYRGPDGRRVSVYQRVERRAVAYQQARPLFGRPAFIMPREFWR